MIFIYNNLVSKDLPDWAYALEEEEKGKVKKISKKTRLTGIEGFNNIFGGRSIKLEKVQESVKFGGDC